MSIELTLTVPPDLAAAMQQAVDSGAYDSTASLVQGALVEWQGRRAEEAFRFAEVKALLDEAWADVDAGRVVDLDPEAIISRGKQRLAERCK